MEEFNNKIVILNDYAKKSFIKKINKLINVKVITLSELKRKYFFDYEQYLFKAVLIVLKDWGIYLRRWMGYDFHHRARDCRQASVDRKR